MNTQHLKYNLTFFRNLGGLLKPYWVSEEKNVAWFLLFLNVVCIVAEIFASIGFNHFHRDFFNALQSVNRAAIIVSLEYFIGVVILYVLALSSNVYFAGLLSLRWRRWLTQNYLKKWLDRHTHYKMQVFNKNIDNPDQRISEDLDKFPTATLSLFQQFLHSLLMLISFSVILWNISKNFSFTLGSTVIVIPGFFCIVAFLYSVVGTWLMHWMGKTLAYLDYKQQHFNADFRFGLIRLREASEQVALHRGETHEDSKFKELFGRVFNNGVSIVSLKTRLMFFNKGYNFISFIVGYIISMPLFIAKKISLGVVTQTSSAFNSVVSGFSVLIEAYDSLADWRSVIHRLTEFNQFMDQLHQEDKPNIVFAEHHQNNICANELNLMLPNGQSLLPTMSLDIPIGKSLLVTGPTGIGKSTLLRAMAGVWTYGQGNIYWPKGAKTSFLPQKPYLPLGTLREVLTYSTDDVDDKQLLALMELNGIAHLSACLMESRNWAQELSLGEQQLIALMRVFIHQPNIVFLDEATSALDERTEKNVYENLRKHLPGVTIVSIGHRSSLKRLHDDHLELLASV